MNQLRRICVEIVENDSEVCYTRKLGVDVYFGYVRLKS